MHFEILVEDQSGKNALDILVPKIIGETNSFYVHKYKGLGRIPKNMKDPRDASRRILLESLSKLLKGFGRTFDGYRKVALESYKAVVILVCDLDNKCLKAFREDLFGILTACSPAPETRFCIAIEEGEAWFLGDLNAVKGAYPNAKDALLKSYVNDSICGTWEKLADAVYPGGSQMLSAKGWWAVGAEKSKWADAISSRMDIENNNSPSFCYFRRKLKELAEIQ